VRPQDFDGKRQVGFVLVLAGKEGAAFERLLEGDGIPTAADDAPEILREGASEKGIERGGNAGGFTLAPVCWICQKAFERGPPVSLAPDGRGRIAGSYP